MGHVRVGGRVKELKRWLARVPVRRRLLVVVVALAVVVGLVLAVRVYPEPADGLVRDRVARRSDPTIFAWPRPRPGEAVIYGQPTALAPFVALPDGRLWRPVVAKDSDGIFGPDLRAPIPVAGQVVDGQDRGSLRGRASSIASDAVAGRWGEVIYEVNPDGTFLRVTSLRYSLRSSTGDRVARGGGVTWAAVKDPVWGADGVRAVRDGMIDDEYVRWEPEPCKLDRPNVQALRGRVPLMQSSGTAYAVACGAIWKIGPDGVLTRWMDGSHDTKTADLLATSTIFAKGEGDTVYAVSGRRTDPAAPDNDEVWRIERGGPATLLARSPIELSALAPQPGRIVAQSYALEALVFIGL